MGQLKVYPPHLQISSKQRYKWSRPVRKKASLKRCIKAGKPVSPSSKLSQLAPEIDPESGLVRVGGRLRRIESGPIDVHPVVLDPSHEVTRLLIKATDARLLHPGPGRVFTELRRQYWILRGRQAIKKYQRTCPE